MELPWNLHGTSRELPCTSNGTPLDHGMPMKLAREVTSIKTDLDPVMSNIGDQKRAEESQCLHMCGVQN